MWSNRNRVLSTSYRGHPMNEYLSTVARSGQVNTPPGSYVTVKEWAMNSFMYENSTVLEVGCSTGFITIEMARYTGARCVGVDLHEESVRSAKENVDRFIADKVSFEKGDASNLPFKDNSFSHVVIGGHLPFIPEEIRKQHIAEALRVLRPWGYMLVALYYYHSTPPPKLVADFNETIGTNLTPQGDRASWSNLFNNLPLTTEYEADYEVSPGDKTRVDQYINQMSPDTRSNWLRYLSLFNENGKYLSYFVKVYRKIPAGDERLMLQIPRGGIYTIKKKISRNL